MKRLSKKKLFETLAELAKTKKAFAHFAKVNDKGYCLNHTAVCDETYGKDSHIYLSFYREDDKREAVQALVRAGFNVRNGWTRSNSLGIDVPVSYFKGCNWSE